jgi:MSHA pilin protein MshC
MKHFSQSGFTLIELIMVIVIMGVLAVFAAPRILNTSDFYARGFHDETLALLRFAQKSAVAQRRTVCVAFESDLVSLSMANSAGATNCASPTVPAMTGPNGAAQVRARSGVSFDSAAPLGWNFNFNGLGQPIAATGGTALAASRMIQIVGAGHVVVEDSTGYVHD